MSWTLSHSVKKQPILVTSRSIYGQCGHCIEMYEDKIFDTLEESVMKLNTKNLEEELGGKVNSIVCCKIFYPHS